MKLAYRLAVLALVAFTSTSSVMALPVYLNQEEYTEALSGKLIEDTGIIVENNTNLGYIVYRDRNGTLKKSNYYVEDLEVEKYPYWENYDRIGYIDQLFPNFEFDPMDTTIDKLDVGDSIYIRKDSEGTIKYISATSDYTMRYGKVQNISSQYITLKDDKGKIYSYHLSMDVVASKGNKVINLSDIKSGDYLKVLVCQRILGAGILEEEVIEVVVDNDNRYIESLYSGNLLSIDSYKNKINFGNTRLLGVNGWLKDKSVNTFDIDNNLTEYWVGNTRVSSNALLRQYKGSNVYMAIEKYLGKDRVAKLNIQNGREQTLKTSEVMYAAPGTIRLLSGETLNVGLDSIIIRDKKMIGSESILVGDRVQAVVNGDNKLMVAKIDSYENADSLEVFRGRIKNIEDNQTFQVETFSLLEDSEWYFHTQPRTFVIDHTTKFYNASGFVVNGIDAFLDYGENNSLNAVYTILADGDKALAVIDMPYTKESIKGEVYKIEEGKLYIKDISYLDRKTNRWKEYSKKNLGAQIVIQPNTIVTKKGEMISLESIQKGDNITLMTDENIKELTEDATKQPEVKGYLINID